MENAFTHIFLTFFLDLQNNFWPTMLPKRNFFLHWSATGRPLLTPFTKFIPKQSSQKYVARDLMPTYISFFRWDGPTMLNCYNVFCYIRMLYEIHSISLLTAITIFKPKKAYDNMGIWPVTSARQVSRWRNICGGLVRNFTCNLKERPSQVFNSCHTKYFLVEFLMGFAAKWAIYDYKAHNKRGWLQLLGCCGCLGSSWWTRTYSI